MIKLHIIYKPRAILQLSNKAGEKHKNMVPGLSYDGLWVISMKKRVSFAKVTTLVLVDWYCLGLGY